jgi:hypothetical protein
VFVVSVLRLLLLLLRAHGGEWFCEVGRCVVKTNSMPLLWIPLTKRMAVSDTARLDVVLRCQLHAIVAAIARRYRSRHVDCYLPSSGFRGDSPGMDLATLDTAMGSNSSRQRDWYRRTVRRYGETYEPNPSRQCEPMSITMCWIGLARKVSQNQTEPFSLRRTCAGSAVITHVV